MKPTLLSLLLFCACAAPPTEIRREAAPEEETREQALQQAEQRRRDIQLVLVRLDQAMETYAQALSSDSVRAENEVGRLFKLLQEMVLDVGPRVVNQGALPREPGENYRRLQAAAADGSKPHEQAIALAALGFSGQNEVMPTILQGAQLEDPELVDRAVFGLATLRAPGTPPGVLAAIAADGKRADASRTQAAWALHQLQGISERRDEIVATWRRFLTELRDALPPGVIVQAVRGLGLSRDKAHVELAAGFLTQTVPKVREAAAVAVARLGGQGQVEKLLAMIGPQETVPNVRLAARKALCELAGQVDHGYDVAAWRKEFDRGR
ncbi:MAG: hypothetical protein FJ265_03185 [Planctomycetes bacterium]|nr:hypothetical protein [Planctomycetota bacterium]